MSAAPAPADRPAPLAAAPLSLFQEFKAFLDKYGVVGLAIAFVIGAALTQLVQAVVADVLMPTINPLFAMLGGDWRDLELRAGPFGPYLIGHLLFATLHFVIVAAFVFVVAKLVLREQSVGKR